MSNLTALQVVTTDVGRGPCPIPYPRRSMPCVQSSASGSDRPILCRDGLRVVLESNKLVVSKHGQFVGKGYDSGGLFCFSLAEF
jgi:hypothetical protein